MSEMNRYKPARQVRYSRHIPDLEALMQAWPAELEELLVRLDTLPSLSDLHDVDLLNSARLVLAFLDVPVCENKVTESLHVLFTLLLEFRDNPHFASLRDSRESSMCEAHGPTALVPRPPQTPP